MPRTARIDIPGLLQHVIARGNERRAIFLDDQDRYAFLKRFSTLLSETGCECLAWVLMPNHIHLLLRPMQIKMGNFMRRLLTGHAVYFNRRHQRCGHLFQNRYHSTICDDDQYLLALIRYIHLNPIKGGIVNNLHALTTYPWSGHFVLMGNKLFLEQQVDEVLRLFGGGGDQARAQYARFLADGLSSKANGVEETRGMVVESDREPIREKFAGVSEIEASAMGSSPTISLSELLNGVAQEKKIAPDLIASRNRSALATRARACFCFRAYNQGHSCASIARLLGVSRTAVWLAVERYGDMCKEGQNR